VRIKYLLLSGLMLGIVACEKAQKQEEAAPQQPQQEQPAQQAPEQQQQQQQQQQQEQQQQQQEQQKQGAQEQKKEAQQQVAQASKGGSGNPDKGKNMFNSKGCTACHQPAADTVGPSLKKIAQAYAGKEDELVKFLKGEGKAIVDPAKEAVMKPQLGQLKGLSEQEFKDLAAYILSHK